jgi:hypothetical protein
MMNDVARLTLRDGHVVLSKPFHRAELMRVVALSLALKEQQAEETQPLTLLPVLLSA